MVPAYEGKKEYIFVSYAHKDSEIVLPIIEQLYEQKYRVWYDEGISPGSEWPQNIADHLNGAAAVIIFVSQNSLDSKNCQNEVSRAAASDKILIEYKLGTQNQVIPDKKIDDGSCSLVSNEEELLKSIPEQFIGDGSGYERQIVRNKYGALWNTLLAIAAFLVLVVIVGLIGLKSGWFDKFLPGLNTQNSVKKESRVIKEQTEEINDFDSLIADAVIMQTDKKELGEKLTFENDEVKANIFHNFGFENLEHEPIYLDLTNVQNESVNFDYATDTTLKYLTYLPNLQEVIIHRGDISDLEILRECPNLKEVILSREMFPIDIPANVNFRVIFSYH